MALPAPKLDDRTFQDLVSEARSLIPRYCPEWTDHNLSDPGIAVIELFAWMVEILLYRLNRVPEKNYIKFMELIGVKLEPPKPARADVTFRLSAPPTEPVTIPRWTEVATVRTETREAVTFSTGSDLTVIIPTLAHALTSADGSGFEDCMPTLRLPDRRVSIFEETPQENNALYLGFEQDISAQTLLLEIASLIEGIGVDPRDPPLAWESWDEEHDRWSALRVEKDTTGGLNTEGQVILHIPYGRTLVQIGGTQAYWIRCRATATREGQRPYHSSPKVTSIDCQCIGGTVPVSHATRITGEVLGRSAGTHGQTFTLQYVPVLTREPGETIEVETQTTGEFEAWEEVPDFSQSGPEDRHFTCDSVSGEIAFGPSIRQPSGQELQYGMVPPSGRQIRFNSYRIGGGSVGNVGPGTITVPKSSIPYVGSVTNLYGAMGGVDAETIENAKMRAPRALGTLTRAVTAEDFENLAMEASSLVARARCLSPSDSGDEVTIKPGAVRLLLVPKVADADRYIAIEELDLGKQLREEVRAFLDERRLLGTRLEISPPRYAPVAVEVRMRGMAGIDPVEASALVEERLYSYINPVTGGPDGTGWPFGGSLTLSEVYAAIQAANDFGYVEDIKIYPVDPETEERRDAVTQMTVARDTIICSHKHRAEIVL